MAEARTNGAARLPVLEVRDLKKHFPIRTGLLQRAGGTVFAVDGVSFSIAQARRLAWSANPAAANRPSAAPCCA